ncbi:hypothetical protein C7S14_0741 [Burkholderia cepacia]|nr:hypothetical protein C7S14_0741 [Burkholderia cepacia]
MQVRKNNRKMVKKTEICLKRFMKSAINQVNRYGCRSDYEMKEY